MDSKSPSVVSSRFVIYWLIVGVPLAWGVWKTAIKLPALFQ